MDNNRLKGRSVTIKDHENISQALRRFKKKIDDSNILEDLKDREAYVKPSIRRKKAAGAAKARWMKKLRDQQLPPKLY
jgi:small subunit ribosomal protein S21